MVRSFRQTLVEEFELRKRRNARYSLRAYAQQLNLAAGQLSEVMQGKKGLSLDKAQTIAAKLKLNLNDCASFIQSVEAECARATDQRSRAKKQLDEKKRLAAVERVIAGDAYQLVSEWQHFAILALTGVPGFKSDVNWIGEQLDIAPELVLQSVERLLRVGLLIRRDGTLTAVDQKVNSTCGTPSEAIRNHHRQIFSRAIRALREIRVDERDFQEFTCAFRPEDLPEIRHKKKQFQQAIYEEYGTRTGRTRVYSMGTFIFPLSRQTCKK